ncbi:MAG: zinc-ribbon domain-containing protein [Myxococcaceae bacterium]
MDVRCERCKTEYEFDDARITEAGVTVKCTTCAHVFKVKKKALVVTTPVKPGESEFSTPPPAGEVVRPREWKVRQASGNIFTFKELTTLQKWIVERKVSREDEISLTGESWKRLGNIAELASFFQVVEEAARANAMGLGGTGRHPAYVGPTPLPLQNPLPMPSPLPPEHREHTSRRPVIPPVSSTRPPPSFNPAHPHAGNEPAFAGDLGDPGFASATPYPRTEGASFGKSMIGVFALVALGAIGYFGYTQWWLPQESAREALARAEQERSAREQFAPKPKPPAPADEPTKPPSMRPVEKTGDPKLAAPKNADAKLSDLKSVKTMAPDDTQVADARPEPTDTSGRDKLLAATKGAKPAAPRDFDWYMDQGDRLRERDQPSGALDAYGQAAELNPDRAEPIAGRGLALLDMGNPVAAQASLQQALKLNPRYGVALIGLAELFKGQGKKDLAIEFYEKYVEANPNGADASVARNSLKKLKDE